MAAGLKLQTACFLLSQESIAYLKKKNAAVLLNCKQCAHMPVLQRDFPLKQTSTKTDHGKQTAYLVKYHWHHLPKCTML